MQKVLFTDFESYAESIRDVNLEARMLRLHQPQWLIRQIEVESIRAQHAVEGSGFLTEGSITPEGWGLLIQAGGTPMPVNGKPLLKNSVAILPPGAEFRFAGQGPMHWISVFIPNAELTENLDASGPRRFVDVVTVDSRLLNRIKAEVSGYVNFAEGGSPYATTSNATKAFRERLLSASRSILRTAMSGLPQMAKPLANRQMLVARAMEFINDNRKHVISVRELAVTTCVSERTLLSAFRQHLGVTPQDYLAVNRLHQARRMLCDSDPGLATVASIATNVGFWDFGRFSGKYRKLFGELPSETLRR